MNVMILVGGFFVHRDPQIFILSAFLAMLGACLGNALGYMMGRISGKEVLKKYGLWVGLGPKELQFLEKQVYKNGFWFIVGGKFHNMLRSFIPYLAAAQGLSGKRFWVANIIGSSIWAVSILLIGMFFVESYEVVLQYLSYILIAVIVGAFGVYSYRNRSKK
jgi:membrane protein DedA with SNARE-associated domain